jgi:(1->4)-alpha-D-glucan 1-alpha-D-glucosylmutase
VDPDNRRPVDFTRRAALLAELESRVAAAGADLRGLAGELLEARRDGRVKLYVIWQALAARRRHPALQPGGGYRPLPVTGERAEHVCAFARVAGDDHVVVVAPRWFTRLKGPGGLPLGQDVWGDTAVSVAGLPAAPRYRNVFTGEPVDPTLALASVLATFPVAVLERGQALTS